MRPMEIVNAIAAKPMQQEIQQAIEALVGFYMVTESGKLLNLNAI